MATGEYKLEKKHKSGLYDIRVYRWTCSCGVFRVKGKDADTDDFGDCKDIEPENRCPYGCGNMTFVEKAPTEDVLEKYNLTIEEYDEIVGVLKEGLSFGSCGLCS